MFSFVPVGTYFALNRYTRSITHIFLKKSLLCEFEIFLFLEEERRSSGDSPSVSLHLVKSPNHMARSAFFVASFFRQMSLVPEFQSAVLVFLKNS
jgi:hypothetical protein